MLDGRSYLTELEAEARRKLSENMAHEFVGKAEELFSIDAYIHALERRARSRLPRENADALIREARDHLDQSIEARLELGEGVEAAQREAVAAFGRPADLVGQATIARMGRWHGLYLATSTGTAVALAATLAWLPILGGFPVLVAAYTFITQIVSLGLACRSRRPLLPLLGATVAFWGGLIGTLALYSELLSADVRSNGLAGLIRLAVLPAFAFLSFLVSLQGTVGFVGRRRRG